MTDPDPNTAGSDPNACTYTFTWNSTTGQWDPPVLAAPGSGLGGGPVAVAECADASKAAGYKPVPPPLPNPPPPNGHKETTSCSNTGGGPGCGPGDDCSDEDVDAPEKEVAKEDREEE